MERLPFLIGAVAFGGIAAGIFAVQRKARTCAVHDHRVGRAALALGGICTLSALGLVAAAILYAP